MADPEHIPGTSPALAAAMRVLEFIELSHPPVIPKKVLAGLHLTTALLPDFDLDRLPSDDRVQFPAVRGLLSPNERKIYISGELSSRQVPWLVYHETGHAAIEWHQRVLYLDTEFTLSPQVKDLMEREANEFAGHMQFLGQRFEREARELPFGLHAAKLLADRYDASYESAIRRYVETQIVECFCEAYDIAETEAGEQSLICRYFIKPKGCATYLPGMLPGQRLSPDDPLVRLLSTGMLNDFAIFEETRFDPATRIAYHEQALCNGYRVFVLRRAL